MHRSYKDQWAGILCYSDSNQSCLNNELHQHQWALTCKTGLSCHFCKLMFVLYASVCECACMCAHIPVCERIKIHHRGWRMILPLRGTQTAPLHLLWTCSKHMWTSGPHTCNCLAIRPLAFFMSAHPQRVCDKWGAGPQVRVSVCMCARASGVPVRALSTTIGDYFLPRAMWGRR